MAATTHIEWTDATWNPITGCSVVSPGCTNCYAMRLAGTRLRHHPSRAGLTIAGKAGPVWNGQVRFNADWLDQPLRWTRPRRIFVCAHGDLFHEDVWDEWIARIYGVMIAAVHLHGHTFQVLTKRPARARELLNDEAFWREVNLRSGAEVFSSTEDQKPAGAVIRDRWQSSSPERPPRGIWLGTSIEDQPRADERLRELLATPAAIRWISVEPLLGPLNLFAAGMKINGKLDVASGERRFIDWVVVGGESGPGARPMHPDWVRSLRDDCADAGVPFFFKQWGAWAPGENLGPATGPATGADYDYDDGWTITSFTAQALEGLHAADEPDVWLTNKKAAGRLLDGVTHDAFPEIDA